MPGTEDQAYELHALVFRALGHPKRLRAIEALSQGEECVCRLALSVGVTEATLSQLLASLRHAGLVATRREGQSVFYRLKDERILKLIAHLAEILEAQLARGERLATSLQV